MNNEQQLENNPDNESSDKLNDSQIKSFDNDLENKAIVFDKVEIKIDNDIVLNGSKEVENAILPEEKLPVNGINSTYVNGVCENTLDVTLVEEAGNTVETVSVVGHF